MNETFGARILAHGRRGQGVQRAKGKRPLAATLARRQRLAMLRHAAGRRAAVLTAASVAPLRGPRGWGARIGRPPAGSTPRAGRRHCGGETRLRQGR
eukprot:5109687-Pyramimonas_sp.AAC.1